MKPNADRLSHKSKSTGKMAAVLGVWVGLVLLAPGVGWGAAYYVSPNGNDGNPGTEAAPFQTIEKARAVVRTVNQGMSGDIVVYLRGGRYILTNTLTFDQTDSGTNGFNVIYSAYPKEKPSISGGQQITGWAPVGNGIYKANVGSLRFRQLYVNDVPAIRARTPNEGTYNRIKSWDEANKRIVVNASETSNWQSLNEVEMIVFKEWTQNNSRISSFSVSGSDAYVSLMEPDRTRNFQTQQYLRQSNQGYFFENAYEFLDAPGEFYLNTGTNELFYRPRTGEDLESVVVFAPKLEKVIKIQGNASSYAKNIQFHGITIEHSNWLYPSSEGFAHWQADASVIGGTSNIPGGIHLQYAERIRFERNIIKNMGGGGLALYSDTRDNSIIGNVFQDISGGAVDVDLALAGRSQRDVIQNNYITRATRNYRGGAGIFGGYPADLLIEHNEITDLPGGGVNVGWGWTTADTNLKNNLIRYNRIHNVLNITEDNAGIYTLSKQPGTKIFENYLYDITVKGLAGSWRNAFGIYLDEGSSVMTVENNVVENVFVGLYLHQSSNNTIINFTGSVRNQSSGNDSFITNNTFDVAKVKATAGIEAAYRDIIPSSAAGQDTTPPVAPTNLRILQ